MGGRRGARHGWAAVFFTVLAVGASMGPAAAQVGGTSALGGRVTDDATGEPLAGISALAWIPSGEAGEEDGGWVGVALATTQADGRYRIGDLQPNDDYRVTFDDVSDRPFRYTHEAYDDAQDIFSGTDIDLPAGTELDGIDAALTMSGGLRGRVTDAVTGSALADVDVFAEPLVGEISDFRLGTVRTAADGTYAFAHLPAGDYRVRFLPQSTADRYAQAWWRERTTAVAADVVTVDRARIREGVDAALQPGATLAGRVTDPDGRPVAFVCVELYDEHGAAVSSGFVGDLGMTAEDGTWRIEALPAGDYRVRVAGCGGGLIGPEVDDVGWAPAWFGGDRAGDAESVAIAAGEERGGVEITLQRGGAVTGFLTDAAGAAVGWACVRAVDAEGWVVAESETHPGDPAAGEGVAGGYQLTGLAAGSYRVLFSDGCSELTGYAPVWHGGADRFEDAAAVVVASGTVTDDIDATVTAEGATVIGVVRERDGGPPVPDVCLDARPRGSAVPVVSGMTGPTGEVHFSGLPSGAVEIIVRECAPGSFTSYRGTLTVELDPGAELDGVVIEAADQVERLAGPTRVETAVEISRATRPSADAVVVARADDYPDALAGAPLAAQLDAPLLLTGGSALHLAAAEEVARLGAETAYVLGSETALSARVVADLEASGVDDVVRIGGANRFETAALIAGRLDGDAVYVVEGGHADPARGWPDAVAVSGLAAAQARPIVLVERDRLPEETRAVLGTAASATIVGGEAAVSAEVAGAIAAAGPAADRLAGPTRYATSLAVAGRAAETGLEPGRTWLATGANWPDALAAGPGAAADGGVLLLVDGDEVSRSPEVERWLDERGADLERVVLVGSRDVVAPNVEAAVRRRFAEPVDVS